MIGPKGRRPPAAALIGALGTGDLTSALVKKESQDGDTGAVPGEGVPPPIARWAFRIDVGGSQTHWDPFPSSKQECPRCPA